MEQNEVEGKIRRASGRVESVVGNLTGDTKMQAEGRIGEMAGRLQDNYGAAVDTVRDTASVVRERAKTRPISTLLIAAGIGYLIGRIGRYI